jgi:hypothetical protein
MKATITLYIATLVTPVMLLFAQSQNFGTMEVGGNPMLYTLTMDIKARSTVLGFEQFHWQASWA